MVQIQKSFDFKQTALYVVPTPIGNLEDMTYRAVRILSEVDLIACEDTRQTKKLLHYFEIQKPLISYHEHNKYEREDALINRLCNGETVALVSDAGMPLISDPGFEIVRRAREEGIKVIVLPGANAALTALAGSGINAETFTFYGFLPRKKKEILEVLKKLGESNHTLIFYESPYRLKDTIQTMSECYAKDRKVTIARELTKKFEEYLYGSLGEILEYIQNDEAELRGEFCIVLEGRQEYQEQSDQWWQELSLIEHVDYYVEEGMSTKDATKKVAKERGQSKREVYQHYHQK